MQKKTATTKIGEELRNGNDEKKKRPLNTTAKSDGKKSAAHHIHARARLCEWKMNLRQRKANEKKT